MKFCRNIKHNLCCGKVKEHWLCCAGFLAVCAIVVMELVNHGVIGV